jgi:hypothetical protein
VARNREILSKIGSKSPETARETAQKRLRNGQDQYGRNITHEVDVFDHHGGWHSWCTFGCTHIGLPVQGCLAPEMAVKWQYGLNSDRAVIMDETAQKRLWPAPVVSTGCPGM